MQTLHHTHAPTHTHAHIQTHTHTHTHTLMRLGLGSILPPGVEWSFVAPVNPDVLGGIGGPLPAWARWFRGGRHSAICKEQSAPPLLESPNNGWHSPVGHTGRPKSRRAHLHLFSRHQLFFPDRLQLLKAVSGAAFIMFFISSVFTRDGALCWAVLQHLLSPFPSIISVDIINREDHVNIY